MYRFLNRYFGTGLAIKLADSLGTVCCIYAIFFLVTIPLRWQTPHDVMGWMTWFVQTFFQGVALPILGVSQKLESRKLMALIQETHDTTMAEFRASSEIRKAILQETRLMKKTMVRLLDIHRELKQLCSKGG